MDLPRIRIAHSLLIFQLTESDLVTRYPTETARLLIYMCGCGIGYLADNIAKAAERLPALEPELRRKLDKGACDEDRRERVSVFR